MAVHVPVREELPPSQRRRKGPAAALELNGWSPHAKHPDIAASGALDAQRALQLQRLAGNAAVSHTIASNNPLQRKPATAIQRDPEKREAKEKVSLGAVSLTGLAGLDLSDRLRLELKSESFASGPLAVGLFGEYEDKGVGNTSAKGLVMLRIGPQRRLFSVTSYAGSKPDGTLVFYLAPSVTIGRLTVKGKGGVEGKKGAGEGKIAWENRAGKLEATAKVKEAKKSGQPPEGSAAVGFSPKKLPITFFGHVSWPSSDSPINIIGPGASREELFPDGIPATRVIFGITGNF